MRLIADSRRGGADGPHGSSTALPVGHDRNVRIPPQAGRSGCFTIDRSAAPDGTRCEYQFHRGHHEACRGQPAVTLDRLPGVRRREARSQSRCRVRRYLRQPGRTARPLGGWLELSIRFAEVASAGRSVRNCHHPRSRSLGSAGDSAVPGPHELSRRTDCAGRPRRCRRPMDNADDRSWFSQNSSMH